MAVNFSDAVKKYGSTTAAFQALGYTKNENGAWTKSGSTNTATNATSTGGGSSSGKTNTSASAHASTATTRTVNEYGYDPNLDYSAAIESAKDRGEDYSQLERERNAKISHYYGGSEPVMYGSNQTYKQLSGSASSGNTAAQSAISNAIQFNANNGSQYMSDNPVYKQMYEAAAAGDWDKVGTLSQQLANYTGKYDENGDEIFNLAEANRYSNQLSNLFNYNANDYYQKKYDAVYGEGAWDGGTGTGQPTYNEYSQARVDAYNAHLKQQSASQQFSDTTANALLNAVQNAGGNLSMVGSGNYADLSQQIKDLYADSLEADLAALKGAYESDSARLESQSELIRNQFLEAQRQTAAQAALQQQKLGETAAAQGLNSGTYGQMALAQSASLQGNLASLAEQQAASLAENDLALAQLLSAYNANVTSAAADNRAKMNEALIEEALRQQNAAAKQQESAREYALSLIASGVMPDVETLAAAGISVSEAQMLYQVATAGATEATNNTPAKKENPNPVNNGGVSEEDIVKMQNALKISADGKWGNESRKAAYNMWGVSDPAEALAIYNAQTPASPKQVTDDTAGVPNNEFATAIQSLSNVLAQTNVNGLSDTAKGNIADKAQAMYDELYDRANDAQRQRLNDILAAYGLI